MPDLVGALGVALIGALICVSGYLNLRSVGKSARPIRSWSRTTAQVTKAWKQDASTAAGDATHHVNYMFTAPETGGSYYGHSELGHPGIESGDEIEVVYDPKSPFDNDLPTARATRSFLSFAYGALTVVGLTLGLGGLAGATLIIVG